MNYRQFLEKVQKEGFPQSAAGNGGGILRQAEKKRYRSL
jgi:hypothetical protein